MNNEVNLTTDQDNAEGIVEEAASAIENKVEQLQFSNRAQRRAFMKKFGKTGETISEAIKKFAYVDLIQRLRELNKKKGEVIDNEDNED